MIVHRVIEPIEDQQFVAVFLEKVLVAHAGFDVRGQRSQAMITLREDISFFIKTVDSMNALGVH